MPPDSPATTLLERTLSSKVVLPWSTWPITVTTGGRRTDSASVSLAAISFRISMSLRTLSSSTSKPKSSATMVRVGMSRRWLMETMIPNFMQALITSMADTFITEASSATDIKSCIFSLWWVFSLASASGSSSRSFRLGLRRRSLAPMLARVCLKVWSTVRALASSCLPTALRPTGFLRPWSTFEAMARMSTRFSLVLVGGGSALRAAPLTSVTAALARSRRLDCSSCWLFLSSSRASSFSSSSFFLSRSSS